MSKTGSTISTDLAISVTLGSGAYLSPLTITNTGGVAPTTRGDAAIVVPTGLSHAKIINEGTIIGAKGRVGHRIGADGAAGGIGITVATTANIVNTGNISGGYGGISYNNSGYSGGNGGNAIAFAAGGSLRNSGTIHGGDGARGNFSAYGGIGVYAAGALHLNNTGAIVGGTGTAASTAHPKYGNGGAAIDLGAGSTLTNGGHISGGLAKYKGTGGNGVDLNTASRFHNTSSITGGNGGESYHGNAGNGGIGVSLGRTSTFANNGAITGGNGGPGVYKANSGGNYSHGGTGGIAVYVGAKSTLQNAKSITGGLGGYGHNYAGTGGEGIDLAGADTIQNTGSIAGGIGGAGEYTNGGSGGIGVNLGASSVLDNTGTITGGTGGATHYYRSYAGNGAVGVTAGGFCTIANAGLIAGGDGTGGGDALLCGNHSKIINTGSVVGGSGGFGGPGISLGAYGTLINHGGTITAGQSAGGGDGAYAVRTGDFTTIVNTGVIAGADGTSSRYAGGSNGGDGVDLSKGGHLVNSGTILAGAGGNTHDEPYAGIGGNGVNAGVSATIINRGIITGGAGGGGAYPNKGGNGVNIFGGALTNSGTITAGAGGTYQNVQAAGGFGISLGGEGTLRNMGLITGGPEGNGGGGVYLNGGTAINYGTIVGRTGDAVQFGSLASTLVIDASAQFTGTVVANPSANDTLTLTGKTPGALNTFSTEFQNFANLSETKAAHWTLYGNITLGAHSNLTNAGQLIVANSLQTAGITLSGGTLEAAGFATIIVGTTYSAPSGTITIDPGATLSGFGQIRGAPIADAGTLSATGGTLTIKDAITGTGTLQIGTDSTIVADSTLSVASIVFNPSGSADLALAIPIPTTAPYPTFSNFGPNDIIDFENTTLTSLNFAAGTLTLYDTKTIIDTLAFAGAYTTSNFALTPDGNGGTNITFVPTDANHPTPADTTAKAWGHFAVPAYNPDELWKFAHGTNYVP